MGVFLSEDWVESVEKTTSSLPKVGEVNGSVSLAIGVAKRKEVRFSWSYEDGVPAPGPSSGPPDLELTISADDAVELFHGRVEPSVSFMRGRLKAAGDGSLLIGFLSASASPDFRAWRDGAIALAES
jgi:putative sterol carrier protein